MSNSTQNDMESRIRKIADYLGCNEGELVSEVTKLLADARREEWVDVDDDCPHTWVFINDSKSLRLCPICNKTQVLATLKEEEI